MFDIAKNTSLGLALLLFLVAGCQKPESAGTAAAQAAPAAPDTNQASSSFLPAAPTAESDCGELGLFATRLVGAIDTQVHWQDNELECLSMPRPNDDGVRLRFSGIVAEQRLAVIVALPGLQVGQAASELPSNITLSVDGSGRFFSTSDLDACFTDIDSTDVNRVTGTVFCTAPLGELNGDGAVSFTEIRFSTAIRESTS